MSLLSRIKKGKKGDAPEDDEQALDADEAEGLLMPIGRGQAGQAEAEPRGQAETDSSAEGEEQLEGGGNEAQEPDQQVETDELMDAPGTGGDAEAALESPAGEDASDADPLASTEAPESSGADPDDPLALFQDDEVLSELGGLTDGLEDTPIAEVMAELRETRAMLQIEGSEIDEAGDE